MAKYGLYSKNNLDECITSINRMDIRGAYFKFRLQKRLSIEEFDKLFVVKECK